MMRKIGSLISPSEKPLNAALPSTGTTDSLDQGKRDPATKRLVNILFQKHMVVQLVQHETDTVLMVYLLNRQRLFMGWVDPELKHDVDIDLSGCGGRVKGVSRLHAALRRMDHMLAIVDLNSANGTYRNGTRLLPGQPYFLRSGDIVCLGKLFFLINVGY